MISKNQIDRLQACQAVVCDLDGTLYLDGNPFPRALEFLKRVKDSGRRLYYFTNNSSHSRENTVRRLLRIGFPALEDSLISSTDCAISYLRRHALFPEIFLIGNPDLEHDFDREGFVRLSAAQIRENHRPRAIVLGFDTTLTYEKIHVAYELILQGLPFVATHADLLCPVSKNTFKPDVGSFIALFEAATDGIRPVVTGKPSTEAVEAIVERAGCETENIAFIGDRLYTDIRMAHRSGMYGILVLSGETSAEMAEKTSDRANLIIPGVEDLIPYL
ncbi:HAD-IIA family hydrolase [candidate division KSB1 bacterium]|nr:HAD-IIA family hydrolase [candidate division KSB1 bacterium]